MIAELIAFTVFIVFFFLVLAHNYVLNRKKKKLISIIIQQELDIDILSSKLSDALALKDSVSDVEQTEGFLKFISESRDWAFKYIEEVQEALGAFSKKVKPELDYLRAHGNLMELSQVKGILAISEAYEELLKVMPESSDSKDQQQG